MRHFCHFLALLTGLLAWSAAQAEAQSQASRVSLGSEYFNWSEYENGTELVNESGARVFVAFEGVSNPVNTFRAAVFAKGYLSQVGYDGQDQNGVPQLSVTDYVGFTTELRGQLAVTGGNYTRTPRVYLQVAGGTDIWQRNIQSSSTAGGYVEEYTILFAKLGLFRESGRAPSYTWGIGVKYPFYIHERVMIGDGTLVEPVGKLGAYAQLGFQFTDHMAIKAVYEDYNFDASPTSKTPLTNHGVPIDVNGDGIASDYIHQPESHQRTLGILLEMRF